MKPIPREPKWDPDEEIVLTIFALAAIAVVLLVGIG